MARKRVRAKRKAVGQSQKKAADYGANKKAFDETLQRYREAADTLLKGGSKEAVESKSAILNWRCDVEKVIERFIKGVSLEAFYETYVEGIGEEDYCSSLDMTSIEREQYAQKRLGSRRHRAEQHLGKAFIQLKLWSPRRERTEVREQQVDQSNVRPFSK